MRCRVLGTDDLAERGVEPIGNFGTTVRDGAARSGMTAKADPAGTDRQLRARQSRRIWGGEQMGDEFAGRLRDFSSMASTLAAKAVMRPSVAPAAARASCAEA